MESGAVFYFQKYKSVCIDIIVYISGEREMEKVSEKIKKKKKRV